MYQQSYVKREGRNLFEAVKTKKRKWKNGYLKNPSAIAKIQLR